MGYIITKLMSLPILILSFSLHELSHGLAAYLMGDKTAKYNGRLSLNPLKHIDWIGFILLLFAGIGWAKPVPVNMYNFKDPKKGMAITALAGPLMNIFLTFIFLVIYAIGVLNGWNDYVMMFLYLGSQYNAVLAMFNLLPIPPLDGSKVLFAFLPQKYYFNLMRYEQYGMILILLLAFTNMSSKIISVGVDNLINKLWHIVVDIFRLLGVA